MEHVIERLRASKAHFKSTSAARAKQHARKWVEDIADYEQLLRVSELSYQDGYMELDEGLYTPFEAVCVAISPEAPDEVGSQLTRLLCGTPLRDRERYLDDRWALAFIKSVKELYNELRDALEDDELPQSSNATSDKKSSPFQSRYDDGIPF